MGARESELKPTSWAVKGLFEGLSFDGINAVPLPHMEKIVFTITTSEGDIKKIHEAPFPTHKQTKDAFIQIAHRVAGEKLQVLL